MSLRDSLLRHDRRFTDVTIPGIDGYVRIRSLTELERAQAVAVSRDDSTRYQATLIAKCVCDDDGNRIFADSDIPEILGMDSRISVALVIAITDHCEPQQLSIEETVKN